MSEAAEATMTLEELVQLCQTELEQTQKSLKEVDLLIQQSSAEVDRLARRNAEVTNRVRQMEMTLDTVPREDLKELYNAALDAQKRLFMMRGQLEKLQGDQKSLERHAAFLERVLEALGQVAPQAAVSAGGEHGRTGAKVENVVVRIIEAQENERQHLARQMHDGPAQSLTNLILQAEICERLFDTDPNQARVELGNLKAAVTSTFQKTREFIFELRPMILDDLGLIPTLKRYVKGFEEKSGIPTTLNVTGKERRLASYTEVTIFRVIQELLNNARQHAAPSHIQVTLDLQADRVRTVVEDDGGGFDVGEVLAAARQRKSLGIATIIERVEMLGGSVEFDSGVGRGTRVVFELPIE